MGVASSTRVVDTIMIVSFHRFVTVTDFLCFLLVLLLTCVSVTCMRVYSNRVVLDNILTDLTAYILNEYANVNHLVSAPRTNKY